MFKYGQNELTVGKALEILRGELKAGITKVAFEKIKASHDIVLSTALKDNAVYGINTGFGPLCDTIISKDKTSELQRKILLSHSVGVGNPIDKDIAKLMLILKVHSLSQGFSGISMEVLDRIRLRWIMGTYGALLWKGLRTALGAGTWWPKTTPLAVGTRQFLQRSTL